MIYSTFERQIRNLRNIITSFILLDFFSVRQVVPASSHRYMYMRPAAITGMGSHYWTLLADGNILLLMREDQVLPITAQYCS